jgi:uncharacterized protein (TIGR03067 family)
MHARRISAMNVGAVHEMMNQFRVEPAKARDAVERLHGGRLACPLKGEYELAGGDRVPARWKSTAWQRESVFVEDRVPDDYCHPFLDWLRGARMELTLDRVTLSTHVELDVKPSSHDADRPVVEVASVSLKPIRRPSAEEPVPHSTARPARPSDEQKIQGTWEVVDDRRSGRTYPKTAGTRLRFDGDRLEEIHKDGSTRRFRFRLRREIRPLGFDSLPEGRQIWDEFGICRLQGNRLLLCIGGPGKPRPTEFAAQPDDACRLVVLERVGTRDPQTD